MAQGTLSGLIWGSVTAVVAVAAVSVMAPMPAPPNVTTTDPAASAPASAPIESAAPAAAEAAAQQDGPSPTSPTAPDTDDTAAIEGADTASIQAPDVGEAAPLGETALPDTEAPDVTAARDTVPSSETVAPQAPASSEDLTISTEPAQPTAPVAEEQPSEVTSTETQEEEPTSAVVAETTDPAQPSVSESVEPDAEDVATDTAPTEEAEQEAVAQDAAPESETESDEVATVEPDPTATDDTSAAEVTQNVGATPSVPRIAALPRVSGGMSDETTPETDQSGTEIAAVTTAPSVRIGQRAGTLTDRGDVELPATQPAAQPSDDAGVTADDPDLAPIARFSAPFENSDEKPLMSIVLLDPEGSIGAEALANFPYPLTFAVNPNDPDAAEKMARHRAAGFEVLALMDVPLTATAQDAETALEVGLGVLTEVVGVIEGLEEGVQGNRALSDQITAVLRDQGYGFVTQNSGLNTVQKLAAKAGVPSAFVFRDFDGAGQTPTVMRRFLDQAAFRAGQEGGVIMMGRVQPDTISALLLWGLQDRANRVALAPVSAVLTMEPANGG